MALLVTDAVVLHAFDYLETSRIIRLATREAGVQSVLARGARRSRARFGSALDLFASGVAEIHTRPGRDLQTLTAFEVTAPRTVLAADLQRFTGASVIAELILRFARDDGGAELFDTLVTALDSIGTSPGDEAVDAAIGSAWNLVARLGFAPTIDNCASCHDELPSDQAAGFSHPVGGVLCSRCVRLVRASRTIPAEARAALRVWVSGEPHALRSEPERRAHQRLLREFLEEHLADGRPLRAYAMWERDWAGASR